MAKREEKGSKSTPESSGVVQELQGQYARAMARARAEAQEAAARDAAMDAVGCPNCGDDLWTSEFGCAKCGAGRKSIIRRHPGIVPALAFLLLLGAGAGAVFTFGVITRNGGVIVNLSMVSFGATFAAGGIWLLGRPKGVMMSGAMGNDAFGRMQYGPAQLATGDQLGMNGAICLTLGVAAILLGVFFGLLA